MLCLARRRKAAIQEGVKKFHLFLGSHMQYQKHYANDADELERSFETEKSMNVSDLKTIDEDSFSVKQHDDQSKEHHEGANLDQSCDQRDHVCYTPAKPLGVRQYRNVTIAACTHVDRTERASMVSIRTVAIVILDSR